YDAGVYRYDGDKWKLQRNSKFRMRSVSDVAVAPDQSLWGIGYEWTKDSAHTPLERVALWSTLILPLTAVFYPIWYRARKAKHDPIAGREALAHATVEMPDELKQKEEPAWKIGIAIVVGLVLLYGGYALTGRYWPGAPRWLVPVALLALHATVTLAGALKKRK